MSGEVYPHVGAVWHYWRTKRLELSEEDLVNKLLETKVQLDFPGGPYGKVARLRRVIDEKFSVEEMRVWEEGYSDIEFWALLIRDVATALGIPTRKIISTDKGRVGSNICYFRQLILKLDREQFAQKLQITPEMLKDIEEEKTDLERIGRIFSALAKLTEEPIFNFFRPGHHIERRTLEWLEKMRAQEKIRKEQTEIAKQKEEERKTKLKAEQAVRIEARKKRLAELEANRAAAAAAAAAAQPAAAAVGTTPAPATQTPN